MKKIIWLAVSVIVLACNQFIPPTLAPTPNEFPPPPPMTPIVEWPQVTATATLEPHLQTILPDDMDDAETFFLIVKTNIAAGNDVGVARLVKYPIQVTMNGGDILLVKLFNDQAEFVDFYDQIFDPEFATAIFNMDDSELTLFSNGVQAGTGELWFNYFCMDLTCSDAQFLITQINK